MGNFTHNFNILYSWEKEKSSTVVFFDMSEGKNLIGIVIQIWIDFCALTWQKRLGSNVDTILKNEDVQRKNFTKS